MITVTSRCKSTVDEYNVIIYDCCVQYITIHKAVSCVDVSSSILRPPVSSTLLPETYLPDDPLGVAPAALHEGAEPRGVGLLGVALHVGPQVGLVVRPRLPEREREREVSGALE